MQILMRDFVFFAHISGWQPGDAWWLAWHFDEVVALNVGVCTLLYVLGIRNAWRQAGIGRIVSRLRFASFLAGMAMILIALLSPLDTISNDLSWVHMIQHMVLMVVAAPLTVFGAPGIVFTWAIPKRSRKRVARIFASNGPGPIAMFQRWLWNPIVVWLLHAGGLWLWHLPRLYQHALVDPFVHDFEHLTFFIVACLFWRVVLDPRRQRSIEPGLGVLYLFTTSIHAMFLGVLMALSPTVWYPIYAGRTQRWGYTVLEDQQLAGVIMWMPACMIYAVVAVFLFVHWMDSLSDIAKPVRTR